MIRSLVIALLALGLLTVLSYQYDSTNRARALADAQRDLAWRAQFTADALDRTLQLRMTQTFTLAALPSLRGYASSDDAARAGRAAVAQSELQAIVAADPNVRAASITDIAGKVVLTTDGSMNANWGERVFVREALAGHLHASVPARDYGEISQYYSAPILDNARNVAGAMVIRVVVQEMWDLLGKQVDVFIVDENGVRIADRTATPQTFVALAPLGPDVIANVMTGKVYGSEITQIRATNLPDLAGAIKRGGTRELSFRDANNQMIYAALGPISTNAWTVVAFESEDAIFAGTWDTLLYEIIIAVVALGAGAVTAYFLIRSIQRTA